MKKAVFECESMWPVFNCDSCKMEFTVGLILQGSVDERLNVTVSGTQGQGNFYCPWCGVKTVKEEV